MIYLKENKKSLERKQKEKAKEMLPRKNPKQNKEQTSTLDGSSIERNVITPVSTTTICADDSSAQSKSDDKKIFDYFSSEVLTMKKDKNKEQTATKINFSNQNCNLKFSLPSALDFSKDLREADIFTHESTARRIILNVRGTEFDVLVAQFDKHPLTRLGKLARLINEKRISAANRNEVLEVCDDFDPARNEFYFDSDADVLKDVLLFYKHDILHFDTNRCASLLQKELEYWNLNDYLIEDCCQTKYNCQKEEIMGELEARNQIQRAKKVKENFGCFMPKLRRKMWHVMDKPSETLIGKIYILLLYIIILTSIICIILTTIPDFTTLDNTNDANTIGSSKIHEIDEINSRRFESESKLVNLKGPLPPPPATTTTTTTKLTTATTTTTTTKPTTTTTTTTTKPTTTTTTDSTATTSTVSISIQSSSTTTTTESTTTMTDSTTTTTTLSITSTTTSTTSSTITSPTTTTSTSTTSISSSITAVTSKLTTTTTTTKLTTTTTSTILIQTLATATSSNNVLGISTTTSTTSQSFFITTTTVQQQLTQTPPQIQPINIITTTTKANNNMQITTTLALLSSSLLTAVSQGQQQLPSTSLTSGPAILNPQQLLPQNQQQQQQQHQILRQKQPLNSAPSNPFGGSKSSGSFYGTNPFATNSTTLNENARILFLIDMSCMLCLMLEFVFRILIHPDKKKIFMSPLFYIELGILLPYLVYLIGSSEPSIGSMMITASIFRCCLLFKFFRHLEMLKMLSDTLKNSLKEIGIYFLYVSFGLLLFGVFVFYVEQSNADTAFTSIPASFWWALITLTTVGYGDIYPKTIGGKFLGSLTAIVGVILIAMPISLIANNFATIYASKIKKERITKTLNEREKHIKLE